MLYKRLQIIVSIFRILTVYLNIDFQIYHWLQFTFFSSRSVTQKNVPSTVVIHYLAWYVVLCDRRYVHSIQQNQKPNFINIDVPINIRLDF